MVGNNGLNTWFCGRPWYRLVQIAHIVSWVRQLTLGTLALDAEDERGFDRVFDGGFRLFPAGVGSRRGLPSFILDPTS